MPELPLRAILASQQLRQRDKPFRHYALEIPVEKPKFLEPHYVGTRARAVSLLNDFDMIADRQKVGCIATLSLADEDPLTRDLILTSPTYRIEVAATPEIGLTQGLVFRRPEQRVAQFAQPRDLPTPLKTHGETLWVPMKREDWQELNGALAALALQLNPWE